MRIPDQARPRARRGRSRVIRRFDARRDEAYGLRPSQYDGEEEAGAEEEENGESGEVEGGGEGSESEVESE